MRYFKIVVCTLLFFILGANFCFASEIEDSERLYKEIVKFIEINKDVLPENMDNICTKYICENNNTFEYDGPKNIINLYRGFSDVKYVEEFKKGRYFMSSLRNVRGSGIYTTTSMDCAKYYSDEKRPETIVKIAINMNGVKILESEYLERLKKLIIKNHNIEFGEFDSKVKEDYIYDSMKDYIDEVFKDPMRKCEELQDLHLSDEDYSRQVEKILSDTRVKMEQDPIYKKLRAERKKYYRTNKSYIWFNAGLLAKLLGYDILHSTDFLRECISFKEEEYLIVNPSLIELNF